jgi:hypothetical protein
MIYPGLDMNAEFRYKSILSAVFQSKLPLQPDSATRRKARHRNRGEPSQVDCMTITIERTAA